MDTQAGPPPTDQLIGQTIGNYLVTQKLGEGGMGSVYLAEHPTIGKKVALKVLHAEYSTNQEVAARFFNEAKAVNDIGHPNIVDIVDFGILQGTPGRDQVVYFIMEHLAGQSVSTLIRNEAPLPPERALAICLQVADALAASHKCGIVHRDLKPDNIILVTRHRERDFVKLLDFGIAKLSSDSPGASRTRTGLVMGTPAYMSPEQCEGRGSVDHRTDIYALGVMLYEMLTGRVPFIGEGYGDILIQHLTQRPTPPSQFRMIPPHVEQIVLKALEKRADMRYPNMDEFMRAIADPVGYVEANGGIGGFLQRQLMPSNAPIQLPMRIATTTNQFGMTPMPGVVPGTPAPGMLSPMIGSIGTPSPGTLVPNSPTTMSGQASTTAHGQVAPAPNTMAGEAPRKRTGFWIAGVVVLAGAGIAIAVVASNSGGGGGTTAPAAGGGSSASGSGSVVTMQVSPGDQTVARKVNLALASTPAGAEIYVSGQDQHQKTPFTVVLDGSDAPVMVQLRLDGYETESREEPLDKGDQRESLSLTAKAGSAVDAGNANASDAGVGSATPANGSATATPANGSGGGSAVIAPNNGSNSAITKPVSSGGGSSSGKPNKPYKPYKPTNGSSTNPGNSGSGGPKHPTGSGPIDHDGTVRPGDI